MINIEGLVLKQLLTIESRSESLEAFSKVKEKYFSPTFATLYKTIKHFYDDVGHVPSLADLKVYRTRDIKTITALSSIELVDTEDVDLDLAIEALADQYAQNLTLDLLSSLVEKISLLNREELQQELASIPLVVDGELEESEKVLTVNELNTFEEPEDTKYDQVIVGLSNLWDSKVGSMRQELALYGGVRGTGKSVVCANAVSNQMDSGNLGLYFTIEMAGKETYQRILAIRAGVDASKIKHNTLDLSDTKKLAQVAAGMYEKGQEVYNKHFIDNHAPDRHAFEKELKATCILKEEGRLVIVDDRDLSLTSIDVQLNKLKARYGDKLKLAVIDYLNQVVLPGHSGVDMYDWKVQVVIAKQLKNLARKYDILIMSPYQMDDSGSARFSRGILDACDSAQLLVVGDKADGVLTLQSDKVRSGADDINCTVSINWNTLKINPAEVAMPEKEEKNQVPSGAMEI